MYNWSSYITPAAIFSSMVIYCPTQTAYEILRARHTTTLPPLSTNTNTKKKQTQTKKVHKHRQKRLPSVLHSWFLFAKHSSKYLELQLTQKHFTTIVVEGMKNIGKILKKRSSETLHFAGGGASCSGQGDSKDRLNWPIECLVRVRARYWKTCKSHGKKTNSARLL